MNCKAVVFPNQTCKTLCSLIYAMEQEVEELSVPNSQALDASLLSPSFDRELDTVLSSVEKLGLPFQGIDPILSTLCQRVQALGKGEGSFKELSLAERENLYVQAILELKEKAELFSQLPAHTPQCNHSPVDDFLQKDACFDTGTGCNNQISVNAALSAAQSIGANTRAALFSLDQLLQSASLFDQYGQTFVPQNTFPESLLESHLCLKVMNSPSDRKEFISSHPICNGQDLFSCLGIETQTILVGSTSQPMISYAEFLHLSREEQTLYDTFHQVYQEAFQTLSDSVGLSSQNPQAVAEAIQKLFSSGDQVKALLTRLRPILTKLVEAFAAAYPRIVQKRQAYLDAIAERIQALRLMEDKPQGCTADPSTCQQCLLTMSKLLYDYLQRLQAFQSGSIPDFFLKALDKISLGAVSAESYFRMKIAVFEGLNYMAEKVCQDPKANESAGEQILASEEQKIVDVVTKKGDKALQEVDEDLKQIGCTQESDTDKFQKALKQLIFSESSRTCALHRLNGSFPKSTGSSSPFEQILRQFPNCSPPDSALNMLPRLEGLACGFYDLWGCLWKDPVQPSLSDDCRDIRKEFWNPVSDPEVHIDPTYSCLTSLKGMARPVIYLQLVGSRIHAKKECQPVEGYINKHDCIPGGSDVCTSTLQTTNSYIGRFCCLSNQEWFSQRGPKLLDAQCAPPTTQPSVNACLTQSHVCCKGSYNPNASVYPWSLDVVQKIPTTFQNCTEDSEYPFFSVFQIFLGNLKNLLAPKKPPYSGSDEEFRSETVAALNTWYSPDISKHLIPLVNYILQQGSITPSDTALLHNFSESELNALISTFSQVDGLDTKAFVQWK